MNANGTAYVSMATVRLIFTFTDPSPLAHATILWLNYRVIGMSGKHCNGNPAERVLPTCEDKARKYDSILSQAVKSPFIRNTSTF